MASLTNLKAVGWSTSTATTTSATYTVVGEWTIGTSVTLNPTHKEDQGMARVSVLVLMPRDVTLLKHNEPNDKRVDALFDAVTPVMAKYHIDTEYPHPEPIPAITVEGRRERYEEAMDDGTLQFGKMNPNWHKNLVSKGAFYDYLSPEARTTLAGVKEVTYIDTTNPEGYFYAWHIGEINRGRWLVKGTALFDEYLLTDGDKRIPCSADAMRVVDVDWGSTNELRKGAGKTHHTDVVIDARDPDNITIHSGLNLRTLRWGENAEDEKAKWHQTFDEIMRSVIKGEDDQGVIMVQVTAWIDA